MTIKELYDYCKEHDAENYVIKIDDIDWDDLNLADVWIKDNQQAVYLA